MVTRATRFNVHGLTVEIELRHPSPGAALEDALGRWGVLDRAAAEGEPDFCITLGFGAPADVDQGWTSVARSGDEVLRAKEGRFALTTPRFNVAFEPGRRRADVLLVPAPEYGEALFEAVGCALGGLFRYAGRFMLHAACVVSPGGTGFLISARSGSGKSTLTTSLVRRGWRYLSDDTVLVRASTGGIVAESFLNHFGLLPSSVFLFPEVQTQYEPLAAQHKHSVDAAALYPGLRIEACCPTVLLLPEITGTERSSVVAVSPLEATLALVGQLNVVAPLEPEVAALQMETARHLAEQCRTYRLCSGRDLISNLDAAERLFLGLEAEAHR